MANLLFPLITGSGNKVFSHNTSENIKIFQAQQNEYFKARPNTHC